MAGRLAAREKWIWGTAIVLAVLLGYLFLFPILILVPGDDFWRTGPSFIFTVLNWLAVPLGWLGKNFEPYIRYIEWVDGWGAAP